MLDSSNYLSVQASITGNFSKYIPKMMLFKSSIQKAIIPMLSVEELQDIKDCRLNMGVIDKLGNIGKEQYQQSMEQDNETLYCLCMAIGTIIKEYDWGIKYVQLDGMCEMAAKIIG